MKHSPKRDQAEPVTMVVAASPETSLADGHKAPLG
jgi:hypothetical protein